MHGARPMRTTRRLQNLQSALPRWWSISNKKTDGGPTLVSIYDEIGNFGVSAGEFLNELSGISGDLDVHISSPGGDVFDAIAIYNSLKARPGTVAVTIDGIAASAASFIAQAASPGHLEMAPFSTMMIHDGFAAGIGNAADMRSLADQLDAASDNIAAIYAARTGKPAEYWRAKMQATTWYKDSEAVADGLADRVRADGNAVRNAWDLSIYNVAGDQDLGNGWVCGPDGKPRFDPDGDGDDDSSPAGDTDNDYFDKDGKQVKPVPPMHPKVQKAMRKAAKKLLKEKAKDAADKVMSDGGMGNLHMPDILNADVDTSEWDANKAWHNGANSDDPAAFYKAITVGRRGGDPSTQNAWALPYRYTPDSAPNAAAVRNALARIDSTQGLTNKAQAQAKLERLMKKINPDYESSASNAAPQWIRNILDQRPSWF